jgi:glycosyltransferase involved in cell wall biosynthesis
MPSAAVPLTRLVALYQAADVHLLASAGEGFGLPTLQAAAAGVVPLASDYSGSRELVSGHGEAIRVRHFVLDTSGLRRALIDIDDAVDKLDAYTAIAHCWSQNHGRQTLCGVIRLEMYRALLHELLEREVYAFAQCLPGEKPWAKAPFVRSADKPRLLTERPHPGRKHLLK